MLVNQNGRWLATILQASCGDSSGGLPEWKALYQITHSWDPAAKQWYDQVDDGQGGVVPWTSYDLQISGYHILYSHEGKVTKSFEQIQKVFGWNGDLMTLPQVQAEGAQVQIETKIETYNGKDTCKVTWLSPADASPERQLEPTDTGRWSQIAAKFARPGATTPGRPAQARPAAGGNGGTRPPMRTSPLPTSRPATTPATPPPARAAAGGPPPRQAPAPAPAATATAEYPPTADGAWQAFCDAYGPLDDEHRTENDRAEQWQRILGELFPGDEDADWADMIEKAPAMIIPF